MSRRNVGRQALVVALASAAEYFAGEDLPHDAHADLNSTPNRHIVKLPTGVGRSGKMNQRGKTEYTDNGNERTDAEHDSDANLLLPVHLQAPQLPERYAKNPQVQSNADAGI